jgi:hypothetical protein
MGAVGAAIANVFFPAICAKFPDIMEKFPVQPSREFGS